MARKANPKATPRGTTPKKANYANFNAAEVAGQPVSAMRTLRKHERGLEDHLVPKPLTLEQKIQKEKKSKKLLNHVKYANAEKHQKEETLFDKFSRLKTGDIILIAQPKSTDSQKFPVLGVKHRLKSTPSVEKITLFMDSKKKEFGFNRILNALEYDVTTNKDGKSVVEKVILQESKDFGIEVEETIYDALKDLDIEDFLIDDTGAHCEVTKVAREKKAEKRIIEIGVTTPLGDEIILRVDQTMEGNGRLVDVDGEMVFGFKNFPSFYKPDFSN